ncbi:MAG: hypothetical protein QM796_13145 [Chthoniobacteraceae bacterium]
MRSYPVGSGSNAITRQRPYLKTWTDKNNNSYTFTFGEDSTAADYGQLIQAASSNGNYVGFDYDVYGHIVDAFTGDGRRLYYSYDGYGDLINVCLPDGTNIGYQYSHSYTDPSNHSKGYSSDHLILEEDKPEGRVLTNTYMSDGSRRVYSQASTVGADYKLVTNATFIYGSNNTTNADKTITGSTDIIDVNSNTTHYEYVNSQITKIVDPLNQAITQEWYQPDDTSLVAYKRSLKDRTDKRGLYTLYQYNPTTGNLMAKILTGNLTGGLPADFTQTAETDYLYTSRNCIEQITDPVGNTTVYTYGDSVHPYLPTQIDYGNASGPITTTILGYEDKSSNGISAHGLLHTKTIGYGASEDASSTITYTNDARGFVTEATQPSGPNNPDVVVDYVYNLRGEVTSATDSAKRATNYAYDDLGNRIWMERHDANGSLVSWEYDYYNQNGELEWVDGPRYNPEDYVWTIHDGAGRVSQQIKWRSQANSDGSGVSAATGADAYATTFYNYDSFGDLKEIHDPRHNLTSMGYDGIGQMLSKTAYEGDSSGAVLSSETFQYEPGGKVKQHIDGLGGTTTTLYTSNGLPYQQTNPDHLIEYWTYDKDGRELSHKMENGSVLATDYSVNRQITKTFSATTGVVQTIETDKYDRRGNVTSKACEDKENGDTTDTFTTGYDLLNRVKTETGPALSGNSAQQITTHIYDGAGVEDTVQDVLGNKTVTDKDAEGRPVMVLVKDPSGNVVRQTTYAYSADHNSVTTTQGTGTNKVTSTVYTDTFGKPVLIQNGDATHSFSLSTYDANENLLTQADEIGVKQGYQTTYTYDGLNRVATQTLPASTAGTGAQTIFSYNAANEVLTRQMPGGVTETNTYDSAARIQTHELDSNTATTEKTTWYYSTNKKWAGKPQQAVTPRDTINYGYDAFMRRNFATSNASLGFWNTWQYNYRGEPTQVYEVTNGSTITEVDRTYDGYGQLSTEQVFLNGNTVESWKQGWDAAGGETICNRRSISATEVKPSILIMQTG